MDRLACVDVPALPLQLLLRQHPSWAAGPTAVVDEDKPQGLILWANESAYRIGVRRGQRYAQGLALCSALRAGVVPPDEIAQSIAAATEALRAFSPHIEPFADDPGVFWLDASGLGGLYPSLYVWAAAVRGALARQGLRSVVVVGFRRFASYAVAKGKGENLVFVDRTQEEKAACRVPLARVGLLPAARDALERLGVRTVGAFARLPRGGVRLRFGAEVERLHRLTTGNSWDPLQALAPEEALAGEIDLDYPHTNVESLVFLSKTILDGLLVRLAARGEALVELGVRLCFDPRQKLPSREDVIRPAMATLDTVQILSLVRLWLEAASLPAPVVRLSASARGVRATTDQLPLFEIAEKPRRDPEAAARAFARLRASFGEQAVVRARLKEGHLPEGRFAWEPLCALTPARPREVGPRPLVRRVLGRPRSLPSSGRDETDGWMLAGIEHGAVERLSGPYRLWGGWWRKEIERDYHFAEMHSGACLWVFYDRRRRHWFVHGHVA